MIKIIVKETHSQVVGLQQIEIIDALSATLAFPVPGHEYNFLFKTGKWDGQEKLLDKNMKFPTGLVSQVSQTLTSFNIQHEIEDRISYPEKVPCIGWKGPELYDYQIAAIDRAIDKGKCVLQMPTGSGKSYTLSRLVAHYNLTTMIYVVSLDLLSQIKQTLESCLGVEVGTIGNGVCDIKKITVCSVWTAGLACGKELEKDDSQEDVEIDDWQPNTAQTEKITDAIKNAQLVILDEAHFAAANSIRMILDSSISAAYSFGFSATYWRENSDDLLLKAAFGEIAYKISATELIERGFLVPPKIIFRDIPKYPVKIPKQWAAVRSTYITNNDVRNDILVKNTLRLLDMGRKPLILFRQLKHGAILAEMLDKENVKFHQVSGALSLEDREVIKKDFSAGNTNLILASAVFDQGIDLPMLDALIQAGGGKSRSKAFQRIGRAIRTYKEGNKKDAIIVETFDQERYVSKHSVIRYNTYLSEPGFKVKTEQAMAKHLDRI